MSVRCSIFEISPCVVCSSFASCSCDRLRAFRNSSSGSCFSAASTRVSTRERASGVILARSSEYLRAAMSCLLLLLLLLLQMREVLCEKLVCDGDHTAVPAIVAGFVASKEQQSHAPRIKGVKHTVRLALVLHPQLAHFAELRAFHLRAVRKGQRRPAFDQEADAKVHRFLLVGR